MSEIEITRSLKGLMERNPAHVVVRRSEWRGHVTEPKRGRSRRIPLTGRLTKALKAHARVGTAVPTPKWGQRRSCTRSRLLCRRNDVSRGQPGFSVFRSTDPATVLDPINDLGSTPERLWVDVPPAGDIFFYKVTQP